MRYASISDRLQRTGQRQVGGAHGRSPPGGQGRGAHLPLDRRARPAAAGRGDRTGRSSRMRSGRTKYSAGQGEPRASARHRRPPHPALRAARSLPEQVVYTAGTQHGLYVAPCHARRGTATRCSSPIPTTPRTRGSSRPRAPRSCRCRTPPEDDFHLTAADARGRRHAAVAGAAAEHAQQPHRRGALAARDRRDRRGVRAARPVDRVRRGVRRPHLRRTVRSPFDRPHLRASLGVGGVDLEVARAARVPRRMGRLPARTRAAGHRRSPRRCCSAASRSSPTPWRWRCRRSTPRCAVLKSTFRERALSAGGSASHGSDGGEGAHAGRWHVRDGRHPPHRAHRASSSPGSCSTSAGGGDAGRELRLAAAPATSGIALDGGSRRDGRGLSSHPRARRERAAMRLGEARRRPARPRVRPGHRVRHPGGAQHRAVPRPASFRVCGRCRPATSRAPGSWPTGGRWSPAGPGVCTLISGPGLTNALTPMAQAFHDSRPMLVLAATTPTDALGRRFGRLHDLDDQAAVAAHGHRVQRDRAAPRRGARAHRPGLRRVPLVTPAPGAPGVPHRPAGAWRCEPLRRSRRRPAGPPHGAAVGRACRRRCTDGADRSPIDRRRWRRHRCRGRAPAPGRDCSTRRWCSPATRRGCCRRRTRCARATCWWCPPCRPRSRRRTAVLVVGQRALRRRPVQRRPGAAVHRLRGPHRHRSRATRPAGRARCPHRRRRRRQALRSLVARSVRTRTVRRRRPHRRHRGARPTPAPGADLVPWIDAIAAARSRRRHRGARLHPARLRRARAAPGRAARARGSRPTAWARSGVRCRWPSARPSPRPTGRCSRWPATAAGCSPWPRWPRPSMRPGHRAGGVGQPWLRADPRVVRRRRSAAHGCRRVVGRSRSASLAASAGQAVDGRHPGCVRTQRCRARSPQGGPQFVRVVVPGSLAPTVRRGRSCS